MLSQENEDDLKCRLCIALQCPATITTAHGDGLEVDYKRKSTIYEKKKRSKDLFLIILWLQTFYKTRTIFEVAPS